MVRLGPFWDDLVILVGSLTAFMAGVFGFFQADLKRVIAFSTCSQLGYSKTNQMCSNPLFLKGGGQAPPLEKGGCYTSYPFL
jgi:formate hydrogenlyase subunit 3/multisubunit Na+/H+ antiporter MnhD subunit